MIYKLLNNKTIYLVIIIFTFLFSISIMKSIYTILVLSCTFASMSILHAQSYSKTELVRLQQSQDYEAAIIYLSAFKDLSPTADYHSAMGYTYYLSEDFINAQRHFTTALSIDSTDKVATIYIGQMALADNEWKKAIHHLKKLTISNPRQFRFWERVGFAYYRLNEIDSAYNYYAQAYQLNNRSSELLLNFVSTQQRLKKYKEADSLVDHYLSAIDATNIKVISKKTELSYFLPDYPQVIKWGEVLLKDSADVAAPYGYLAFTYLHTGRYKDIAPLVKWLRQENKATAEILYCSALAYTKLKMYDSSNALLDECLSMALQKEAVSYFNAKADNYEEQRNYQKTIAYHDTSYYIFKKPLDLYYAGRIYDKYLKDKKKAVTYYQRFKRLFGSPANVGEAEIVKYVNRWLSENNTQ